MSIQNTSSAQLSITEVPGLVFAPGSIRKVTPATVMHPAVVKYLGRGLKLVEPSAPAPLILESKEVEKAEPVTEPTPAPAVTPLEKPVDAAGSNIREALLMAPGVNEKNVDDILRVTPSLEQLKSIDKDDLVDATGISSSNAKKLLFWAQSR